MPEAGGCSKGSMGDRDTMETGDTGLTGLTGPTVLSNDLTEIKPKMVTNQ